MTASVPTRWPASTGAARPPPSAASAAKKLGIVGLGRIGTATALRAKAFGLEVMAYDPYLAWGQEIALGVTRMADLHDMLGKADIVSLHAPLTEETRHIIDAAALAAMKPEAVLVNTARGALIDLDALHAALKENRIAAGRPRRTAEGTAGSRSSADARFP